MNLDFIQNALGKDQEQLKRILEQIEKRTAGINRESHNLDVAIEARDANIRALGEKLSMLRMKEAKPFVVKNVSPKRCPSRRKSLFRKRELSDWTKDDATEHMKELSDEIARLSLLPMGLSSKDLEDQVADISATRLYEGKAINLIKVARQRGLSDGKINRFLQKKGLPDITIKRCFSIAASKEENQASMKQMPELPKLPNQREDTNSDSEELEEYDFSSSPIRISSGKAGL